MTKLRLHKIQLKSFLMGGMLLSNSFIPLKAYMGLDELVDRVNGEGAKRPYRAKEYCEISQAPDAVLSKPEKLESLLGFYEHLGDKDLHPTILQAVKQGLVYMIGQWEELVQEDALSDQFQENQSLAQPLTAC